MDGNETIRIDKKRLRMIMNGDIPYDNLTEEEKKVVKPEDCAEHDPMKRKNRIKRWFK